MSLDAAVDKFIDRTAALKFQNAFNPYVDVCSEFDSPCAPQLRRANLRAVLLKAISGPVHAIWIGRDLGYLGGRRTGLALTDESNLSACGERYGIPAPMRATLGPVVREKTAQRVWSLLPSISQTVVLWNVFPLHPHRPGNQRSNRPHTAEERNAGVQLLKHLVALTRPASVVAIGNDAAAAAASLGVEILAVRHPSYGGERVFEQSIRQLYKLPQVAPKEQLSLDF